MDVNGVTAFRNLQWSLTEKKSLKVIASTSDEQTIYAKRFTVRTQLSPRAPIHQHRTHKSLYLLAGIVLQIRNVIAHSTVEAV